VLLNEVVGNALLPSLCTAAQQHDSKVFHARSVHHEPIRMRAGCCCACPAHITNCRHAAYESSCACLLHMTMRKPRVGRKGISEVGQSQGILSTDSSVADSAAATSAVPTLTCSTRSLPCTCRHLRSSSSLQCCGVCQHTGSF
jgi:hypothetical protein